MERKTVYTLTIEIMIKVMQTHKKTGRLQTDLSSGIPGFREPCHVEIALEAGKVISCSITGRQRLLLTGAKAYQELMRQGRLDWIFAPQTQPLTTSAPITGSLSIVPTRVAISQTQPATSAPITGSLSIIPTRVAIPQAQTTTSAPITDIIPTRVTSPLTKPATSAPITGSLSIIPTRTTSPLTKPATSAPITDSSSIIPTRVINPQTRHTIARPRRIATLTKWQMRPWHGIYKQVYSLADGNRSVTEIAVLLSATPEAIKEILYDLQSIHVVTME